MNVNGLMMSGITRRKVASRTKPWLLLAEVYPTLPPPPLPEDEDLPAAKRPRLEAPSSVSTAGDGVVHEYTATDSPDDSSNDTTTDLVTSAALLPNATPFRTPRISWKPEEDAKLTEAVKILGKKWASVGRMVPGRTNQQCRGRWLNILDPVSGSKDKARISWKPAEDAKLIEAVKKYGTDWLVVAAMVPDRTNQMCRQRWINTLDPANEKNTGKWTPEEDAKLTEAVKKHGKDWILVAAMIPGRTNSLCRQRWINTVDPANEKSLGKWTTDEDAKLTEEVKKHGKDWLAVAAMVPGRSNLQCRRRWINTVDPAKEKKGKNRLNWKPEEDTKLAEAVTKYGKHWLAVAALIPGRTHKQCRERWVKILDPNRISNPVEEEHNAGNDETLASVPI
jgi:hypothetical protein